MKDLLTTRELAEAIGASESSLRRWIDEGCICVARTVGGHRRIPLAEAVRFIRESGSFVARPELLGLTEWTAPQTSQEVRPTDNERLYQALLSGDGMRVRSLTLSLYLAGHTIADICDGAVRQAMHRIGELWHHEPEGILLEHRAVDIAVSAINHLHTMLPPASAEAPVALGGGPADDPYVLPSLMAAVTLAEVGYRTANYGPNTPVHLLADAAAKTDAHLVWLSVSAPRDLDLLREQVDSLAAGLAQRGGQLVIGGQRMAPTFFPPRPNVHPVGTMRELAAFARGLIAAR